MEAFAEIPAQPGCRQRHARAAGRLMILGKTLSLYFSRQFLRASLSVFVTIFTLAYTLDFVELMRRTSETPNTGAWLLALLSLFRIPIVAEQVVPFAVLFGSL